MNVVRSILLVHLFVLHYCNLFAQSDTIPPLAEPVLPPVEQSENEDIIEDFIQQNNDEEIDFDFNTIFEDLEIYAENPLNLNIATKEELAELRLLSDIQINNLIVYRQQLGDLIAIYELQAVPGFDLNTINRILPYVGVSGGLDDYNLSIPTMLLNGKNELFIRWARVLETKRGFKPITPEADDTPYLGDPNKLYIRFKHSYENRLSYGFTAEKDEGEEFFKGSNEQGFDFYSAHLYLKDYKQWLKDLAIGDFSVSFGQGLILYSGFGRGKSSMVMNVKRSRRTIKKYSSVNELSFMRGVGATFNLNQHFEISAFASLRKRDANLGQADTTDLDAEIRTFTSLQGSGLHRTINEIEDENAIQQMATGGSLRYKTNQFHIAVNALYNRFDKDLVRRFQPYSQFYFSGRELLNVSLDYSYIYQNFNFFGETAMSDNGKVATINGLLLGLDRNMDMAIIHRYYPKDYQSIEPNSFGETSGARNENGVYIGLEIRPFNHWKIHTYFDLYRHPWLRFSVDAPSKGYDFLWRVTYFQKRKIEAYVQVRYENKEVNAPGNSTKTDFLVNAELFQVRLQVSNKVTKALELRTRLDLGYAKDGVNDIQKGAVLYQDVIYKPIGFPLSITSRFALFGTDGFNIRYYAYENDLLYTFSVPAYYNNGTRFYINLRYKGIRKLTLEARYAQTYWSNQETIGSGNERIDGQTRSEVKAQVKWEF